MLGFHRAAIVPAVDERHDQAIANRTKTNKHGLVWKSPSATLLPRQRPTPQELAICGSSLKFLSNANAIFWQTVRKLVDVDGRDD
jgi:hypothetical protein